LAPKAWTPFPFYYSAPFVEEAASPCWFTWQDCVCKACQLGKSKQLPFVESTRCTLGPLELIHSNLWTSPIPSTSGCKYYVLFVDDYSRFTWLYPILNKSELFQCFVKFKLLVENLFTTKIKQFQSDNGGEYTSKQFKDYLSQSGILHRLSCPHTS
jgi:transposase InsO family protein